MKNVANAYSGLFMVLNGIFIRSRCYGFPNGTLINGMLTGYTLWLFNSSPWYRWPIEINGLPIKNGDFPWLC